MNIALILNYKAASESISCVESVLAHCPGIDRVLLIDNDSGDGSMEAFERWKTDKAMDKVTLLASPQNNGFAGGNNFALRWARENLPDARHFWILNNDTYLDRDAFAPLEQALLEDDRRFVGSVVLNAENGDLECFGGGKLYPLLGKARLLGKGRSLADVQRDHQEPDYLMGCSLAFSATLLDRIGLMDERYFMYSEEVDWQYRAKNLGISIKVVAQSVIYHHGSLSSGGRSAFYHYYRNRAATRFNKRFYGLLFAFTSACMLSTITVIKEFKRPALAWSGIKGAFKGVTMSVE